jgi:hypothetical protein
MKNPILELHPIFEKWDPRRALITLARGVVGHRHGARRWFVVWPAVRRR